MTRIFWHYSVFNLGGAELSTIRLLAALGQRGLAPVLALNLPGGTAETRLDGSFEVRHLRPSATPRPGRDGLASLRPHAAAQYVLARSVAAARTARLGIGERFGAAVVGLQGLSPHLVGRVVPAGRRLHFIRNDLAECDPQGRIARAIRASAHRFDAYVCVSEAAHRSLLRVEPRLADKAHTIANLLGADAIRAAADGPSPYTTTTGRRRVVTVARLSDRAKGLSRMVNVHRTLLGAGYDFDWHVVGEGPDRPMLEKAIAAAGIGERMHLHGRRDNPYPFVRHADIVAVLSHYEGLSGAINEAKVLGRPVIATDVGGAREQLGNGGGLVVASQEGAIAAGLASLLYAPQRCAALARTPLPAHLLDDGAKLDRLIALLCGEGDRRRC